MRRLVTRKLTKPGEQQQQLLPFAEAVKRKGLGKAIAELPSTVKMVAAFAKLGAVLARPFSRDKYFRNTGKKVDREKARHGPVV